MPFFERKLLAVLLPAVAWGFLVVLKLYYMHRNFGGSYGPTSDEVLFSQILLIEGGVLCLVALVPPFRAWRARRFDGVMIASVTASALFLILWFPAGVEGFMRRTGMIA